MQLNTQELLHSKGIYYGLNRITKSAIVFDRTQLTVPHGFILGVPGSGKSFTAKMEIMQSFFNTENEIIIVDTNDEYKALAEIFGGEVVDISENPEHHINPLDLTKKTTDENDLINETIYQKEYFFFSFFSAILGNIDLQLIQKKVISVCLYSVYKEYADKIPTLKEYYEILSRYGEKNTDENAETAKFLKSALYPYVHGSKNIFSNKTNINNGRFVVYNISKIGYSMRSVGMISVLENLWGKVIKNSLKGVRTQIYIDDIYELFRYKLCVSFFYELYKRARILGGIFTGITLKQIKN